MYNMRKFAIKLVIIGNILNFFTGTFSKDVKVILIACQKTSTTVVGSKANENYVQCYLNSKSLLYIKRETFNKSFTLDFINILLLKLNKFDGLVKL